MERAFAFAVRRKERGCQMLSLLPLGEGQDEGGQAEGALCMTFVHFVS
jgi:hypothetical protein